MHCSGRQCWMVVETVVAVAATAVSCHLLCRADKPNAAAHMSKRPASDFPRKSMLGIGRGDIHVYAATFTN